MNSRASGKRWLALNSLLDSAKSNPGRRHILVEADGQWEISYRPAPVFKSITIDEFGDWSSVVKPGEEPR